MKIYKFIESAVILGFFVFCMIYSFVWMAGLC